MSLPAGSRLGAYEVIAAIGAGGMGEVYRARDTKLNRDVALKILPAAVATDPDRHARLTREAQVLASLNDPRIAAIYGLEDSSGVLALVMELVDGEDLAQRIARGAIPIEEALPIATQIADALQTAHDHGIVHRDLKPANIKVRPDGTVKVLDFGLAKALDAQPGGAGAQLSLSPTLTSPALMTSVGMILGTAAYMSPEQARGKPVDKRADIWAFGVVMYEMLSGRPAFTGDDTTEVIAAVVKTTPNWSAVPPQTSPAIFALIQGCLEKDPRARIGDIAVARFLLAGNAAGIGARPLPARRPPSWRQAMPWVVSAVSMLAALSLLMLWAPWRAEAPADRPLIRLDVDLGSDASLPTATSAGSAVAIAPDGTRIVYVSGAPTRLMLRRLNDARTVELPGTAGAAAPLLFSSDGQWVTFMSGGKAKKISVEGGAVVLLGDSPARDGGWGDDGRTLITRDVRQVTAGGTVEAIAQPAAGGLALGEAQVLPGGRAVLFSADYPGPVDKTTIDVITVADRRRKTVIRGGASPRYLATAQGVGHLIYANGATLFAIPFDVNALETRGTAIPLLDDLANEPLVGVAQFDVSRTGTLIYRKASGGARALTTLQWVAAAGRTAMPAKPAVIQDPAVSPDGKRIAVTIADTGGTDVWIYDPQRDALTRVTFGGSVYRTPRWSPDGRFLVFSDVGRGLMQARADGAVQPQPLTRSQSYQIASSFSPDGKLLAFTEATGGDIWTVSLEEQDGVLKAGTPQAFRKGGALNPVPSFSPDGRWIAYQSDEAGPPEVFVTAFPAPASGGGKWQVSNGGGLAPRWSKTGHDLMYRSGDQIFAVGYAADGGRFLTEKPRLLIPKLGAALQANGVAWDLAPDGARVAVVTPIESEATPRQEHEVVFLMNLFDELRRRAPAGK